MPVEAVEKDGKIDVRFNEKLTVYETASLAKQLKDLELPGSSVCLDLGGVTECDTAGIQLVCSVIKTVLRGGGDLTFKEVSPSVEDTARKIGLSPVDVLCMLKAEQAGRDSD